MRHQQQYLPKVRKTGVFNPFEAIRRSHKASRDHLQEAKRKLDLAYTRVFFGTADDGDFGTLATYLLYGAVLAENFEDIRANAFSKAILQLRVVKRLQSREETAPREYISQTYSQFQLAAAMVFELTIGEQMKLRDYIRENGQRLMNSIQTPEAVLTEEKRLKEAIELGEFQHVETFHSEESEADKEV